MHGVCWVRWICLLANKSLERAVSDSLDSIAWKVGGAWRERRPERETHFLDTQNSLTRVAFLFYGASQGFCGVRKKRSANRLAPAPCFLSRSNDDLRMNEQRRVSRTLTQVQTRLKCLLLLRRVKRSSSSKLIILLSYFPHASWYDFNVRFLFPICVTFS